MKPAPRRACLERGAPFVHFAPSLRELRSAACCRSGVLQRPFRAAAPLQGCSALSSRSASARYGEFEFVFTR